MKNLLLAGYTLFWGTGVLLLLLAGGCDKERIEETVTEDETIGENENTLSEGEYYYWYKNEKYPLIIDNGKRFLLFDEFPDADELSRRLGILNSQIEEIRLFSHSATLIPYGSGQETQKEKYWTVVNDLTEESELSAIDLVYEAPFFRTGNDTEVGLSHLFYVKLHRPEDLARLEELAETNLVTILGNNSFMPQWYILACDKDSKGNALEMANHFYESALFSASQADLMEDSLADSSQLY